MASVLEHMGYGITTRSPSSPAAAIGMLLLDGAVGLGGSFGLGELYGHYADKSKLAKYSPEIVAGVGMVAAICQ